MSAVDRVHELLWQELQTGDSDVRSRVRALVDENLPLAPPLERDQVVAAVTARFDGLGVLQPLADDTSVTEIMVNAGREVWVERSGRLERVDVAVDPEAVEQLARRLAANAGRRIDRSSPTVDVRLPDGSRLHAILPPLAVDGPTVTIRRFRRTPVELDELAPPACGSLLRMAVRRRATVVIAGGTSTGKTTLLNALGGELPSAERVVTIEDSAELRIPTDHVVRLETRPGIAEAASVDLRELVRNALRMRPDRIICGEMRGAEALDLVQAMNTGHRGSLTTVHANSAADSLRRIETMMLVGDADLPLSAIRQQLAGSIDLIVTMVRGAAGARRVDGVFELPNEPGPAWALRRLFGGTGLLVDPRRTWAS